MYFSENDKSNGESKPLCGKTNCVTNSLTLSKKWVDVTVGNKFFTEHSANVLWCYNFQAPECGFCSVAKSLIRRENFSIRLEKELSSTFW